MIAVLLESPFQIPVVHVTLERLAGKGGARMARGMGASSSIASALTRALTEAVQMMRSLDTGVDIERSITDMRALWFTGAARSIFPSLFEPTSAPEVDWEDAYARIPQSRRAEDVLQAVLERTERAGVRFYRHVLAASPSFAAVRCIGDRILPLDDAYFPQLNRFADWDAAPAAAHVYSGPLFM